MLKEKISFVKFFSIFFYPDDLHRIIPVNGQILPSMGSMFRMDGQKVLDADPSLKNIKGKPSSFFSRSGTPDFLEEMPCCL